MGEMSDIHHMAEEWRRTMDGRARRRKEIRKQVGWLNKAYLVEHIPPGEELDAPHAIVAAFSTPEEARIHVVGLGARVDDEDYDLFHAVSIDEDGIKYKNDAMYLITELPIRELASDLLWG